MKIDNSLETAKTRMFIILSIIIFIVSLGYIYMVGFYVGKYTLILSAICLLSYLYIMVKKPYLFLFNDEGNKIIIRHYHVHPFMRKYVSIEIPKQAFLKYEIKKKLNNLQTELTVYQRTNKGEFQYPSISISLLSKKDMKKLEQALNSNMPK